MNKCFAFLLCFLFFLIYPSGSALAANRADSVNSLLLRPKVDITKTASVSNFTIQRDRGVFTLHTGKFYFAKPIYGNTVMALYLGSGTFNITPPTQVERGHLKRVLGTDSIQMTFTALFLAFTDSTFQEIVRNANITADKIEDKVSDYFDASARYLGDENSGFIDQHWGLMADVLNENKHGFFYSLMTNRNPGSLVHGTLSSWREDPLVFLINPYDGENVQLLRRVNGTGTGFYQETISKFHNQEHLSKPAYLRSEIKPRFNVDKYQMHVKIADGLKTSIEAILTVNPNVRLDWLNFDLYYKLDVDSVTVDGQKHEFFRAAVIDKGFEKWTSSPLWIKTDSKLRNFERSTIVIFYHGEIIGRENDQIYLKASDDWYPSHVVSRKQTHQFDINFEYPKMYKVISIGVRTDSKKTKKTNIERWITTHPVRHCTFNIGLFKEFTFKDDRIPEVHIVHRFDRDEKVLKNQVMADIANSYAYYEQLFGSTPLKSIYVAEHPFSHSEAYHGFVNLWWRAFLSDWNDGEDELIRAHEIAHQWWGIRLDFESYHDQWLSEAFAEYSAMMYVQQSMKNNDEFFRLLKESKERIIGNRKSIMGKLLGDDQEAGPIWLGYRTSSSTTRGDYQLIIYEKGMWILHMLRNMMIDINTMQEIRFGSLMKDFFQSYAGKNASTNDFKLFCDKHFNTNMDWFFNQWIYGTEIPKYEFAYKVSKLEGDKFITRCQVRQMNVSENFRAIVPVTVDFGNKRYARLRVVIQNPFAEFDLPVMPLEPKKIIFNDFESVLCEVDYVDWKN